MVIAKAAVRIVLVSLEKQGPITVPAYNTWLPYQPVLWSKAYSRAASDCEYAGFRILTG